MRTALTLAAAAFALGGCSDKLSQEQAQEKLESYFASLMEAPKKYYPLSTSTIEAPPKYQAGRWEGYTWALHRYQFTTADGARQERTDTLLIKGDTVLFHNPQFPQ